MVSCSGAFLAFVEESADRIVKFFQVSQGGVSDVGLAWIYKDKYQ